MSKEAAMAFRDKVCKTPALQQQVKAAIESGSDLTEAVRLGKTCGCEFTAEEAAECLQCLGSDELSEFELEMVAGGAGKGGSKRPGGHPGGGGGGVNRGGGNIVGVGGGNLIGDGGGTFRSQGW